MFSLLALRRQLISGSQERAYQYRYIPAQSLHAAEIRRYSKTMNPTDHAGPNDFESYYYPYLDLPAITSHVHPRFVICNIGLKMEDSDNVLQFFGSNSALPTDDKALIEDAITIFRKWTADIPTKTNFYKERHFGGPDGDDNSDITRVGRLNDQGVRRSTRAHPNGLLDTPSEKRSRKRPRGQQESDPVSLDGETLRALDEDASPGKKLRLKRDSVAAWISSISEVKFDALTVSYFLKSPFLFHISFNRLLLSDVGSTSPSCHTTPRHLAIARW